MTPNSSLLQWLATFELDGQAAVELKDGAYYNLADGYVSARILNQISPQYFSDKWLDGIKPVPPNGSWRLRVSNLKRILQKIHDYASDLQSSQFRPSAINPDVAVIAQNFDSDQISRLIQLILFCAINSDKKQEYVERIHNLPTQVKHDIKEAIEELLVNNNGSIYNRKLNTSHVGNDSVRSENELETTTATTSGQTRTSTSTAATTTVSSPSRPGSNYRAFLRRDSSQISDDLSSSRRSESHLDTSTQSTQDNPNETIDEIRQKLNAALTVKEEKAQACHELELRLKRLQIEKDQLADENERLTSEKNHAAKTPPSPMKFLDSRRQSQGRDVEHVDTDSREIENRLKNIEEEKSHKLILQQNRKLQSELHRLKEDIIKIETEKEDYRLKSNLLKEDLDKITMKHDELRKKAEQAKRLQDELDEHKHISEKVVNYEAMIENLVKKNNEMKKELKSIEEKNVAHIHKIVSLEEENSELNNAINRIEIYKKQLHEVQVKLSRETHRADKAEIELARLVEKYSEARKENEKLYETTNQLMRDGANAMAAQSHQQSSGLLPTNEVVYGQNRDFDSVSLKGTTPATGQTRLGGKDMDVGGDYAAQAGNDILSSLSNPTIELKERLARLECENELLQNKLNSKRESDQSVLSGLLESANARCTKLDAEARQSRQKILQLELRLRDLTTNPHNGASTSNAAFNEIGSDNTLTLMNRVEELQRLLFQKEQELRDSETKYRKNLAKAKELIRTLNSNQSLGGSLHPSCMSSASPFNSSSLDETNLLKQELRDREERLIEMERGFTEFKKLKEIHERLILSAFYGLTTPMQWRNIEKRLERTTLTSPSNTASSSMNIHSKHSH